MVTMKYEIRFRPAYALLAVTLEQGESIVAEAGAMTSMQPTITAKTRKREKSFWGSLGLALAGGQSFFVNEYTATGGRGEITLSAAPLGDIDTLTLSAGKGYILQKAAYVASEGGIDLDVQWEGFTKGLFGQGLFMVRASGEGRLFINTFGAIDHRVLAPGSA